MIHTGYSVNHFTKIGYKDFTRSNFTNKEKFSLNVAKTESIPFNVDEVIANLESGNKETISSLENLGLNYSLTEYHNGYKIKFEKDGNTYTVAYNEETTSLDNQPITSDVEISNSGTQNNDSKTDINNIELPVPPKTSDYSKEVTYADGMKETLVDEDAYNQAMQDYQVQKAEYDAKVQEHNLQVAERQKQNIINEMQEEWDVFNEQVNELRQELETKGTGSKMMNSVIHELSADYAELIQRKKEQKLKNVDLLIQNLNNTIPNPPSKSFYETKEEYTDAMNVYTYQKFLYEKQQKEFELKTRLLEKRIEKIDNKLTQIKRMLFGTTA